MDKYEKKVIEELKKHFGFNCELQYIGKKRFGGSNITTYYFIDNVLGITWEYDLNPRQWAEIAYND